MTMNLVWQLLCWCWWRKRLNADCVMAEQDNKGEMNARKKLHNVGMLLHCLMWLFPCIALLWLFPCIALCGYPLELYYVAIPKVAECHRSCGYIHVKKWLNVEKLILMGVKAHLSVFSLSLFLSEVQIFGRLLRWCWSQRLITDCVISISHTSYLLHCIALLCIVVAIPLHGIVALKSVNVAWFLAGP